MFPKAPGVKERRIGQGIGIRVLYFLFHKIPGVKDTDILHGFSRENAAKRCQHAACLLAKTILKHMVLHKSNATGCQNAACLPACLSRKNKYVPSYLPDSLPEYLHAYLPTCITNKSIITYGSKCIDTAYLPAYLPTCLPAYLPFQINRSTHE